MTGLGSCCGCGRPEEAEAMLGKCLELQREELPKDDERALATMADLGAVLGLAIRMFGQVPSCWPGKLSA
eukprot:3543423-Rhodomonas_salina.1